MKYIYDVAIGTTRYHCLKGKQAMCEHNHSIEISSWETIEGWQVESQITELGERTRRDPVLPAALFLQTWSAGELLERARDGDREGGGQDAKPSGFILLTRYGDYAVLMTPWECASPSDIFSTMAGWWGCLLSHASLTFTARDHHPDDSDLPWNNRRRIGCATIAHTHNLHM